MRMRREFERVHLSAHGTIALLTLNHPAVLNAISPGMAEGMTNALAWAGDKANGFRALVLTGEGRGFCSGANLAEAAARGDGPGDAGKHLEEHYHPLLRRLRDFELPILTAVNGVAAGVGMSIALMGDLVLAARSAYFLQAFARIGLVPDGGSTWLLPRLIGLARARELSLLAEKLPAEAALQWGLINRVYDDTALLGEAIGMAERLAEGPTIALAATRSLFWASPQNTYEEQLDLERRQQRLAGSTEDFVEGVQAFLQKRKARFSGR
jgi:2-(1,2-epoxy-1,2-dihydrophenyl)acetyl-CoA isomerase